MIDIKKLRENPNLFQKASISKRVNIDISQVLKLDEQNRDLIGRINESRSQLKSQSKSKPMPENIEKLKILGTEIKSLEIKQTNTQNELDKLLHKIPNLPSDDTPLGKDENENIVIKEVGEKPTFDFKPKEHWELGEALGIIDIERATKVTGTRFAYLKKGLVHMQFALIQHAMGIATDEKILKKIIKSEKLTVSSKPFVPVIPPVLMKPDIMDRMSRLEPKEERYHIPSDDLYLIGSAEHTLGPMYLDEVLPEDELPLRMIGYSTSFRREAGSYGKDMKGIIRLHQFDKVEYESYTTAESSFQEHLFFIALQEYMMQSLKIPYRLVKSCTGDLGDPNARKVDVEAWMPGQDTYRETHSADYMTDYQARRLKIRVKRKNDALELIHTNDATAFAIGRTLVAIMENYQQKDGSIKVPTILQKYMNGMKKISK